jgi:hypothetical protein
MLTIGCVACLECGISHNVHHQGEFREGVRKQAKRILGTSLIAYLHPLSIL